MLENVQISAILEASKMDVRLPFKILAAVLLLAGFSAHAANTQARLVLAVETAKAGDTVMAGIYLHMAKDWHTYWRNSGQSGLPTTIKWELPSGVAPGEI